VSKYTEVGLGRLMWVEQSRYGDDWRVYVRLDETFDEGVIGQGATPNEALASAWATVQLLEQAIVKMIHQPAALSLKS